MSTAGVRERERERDWDARSSYSTRDRDDARGTTTVRRYRYGGDDNASSRDDERLHVDIRTSHRDRSREPDREEVRRYEREVARGDYDRGYDRDRDRDYYRRDRDRDDDDGWREVSITRDVARDPPRREDYELDRYTRSTEYYARPESRHDDRRSPQTIVIRNEAPQPIIIRDNPPARDREVIIRETRERSPSPKREESHEETKEEKLELIERKSEVSAAPSRKDHQEDDYYYQRTTRDIVHRNREDVDDREYRRDVGPRDSVSNHGRGRERDYEDEVHYRRVVEEDGTVRDSSPHHKRHLAEGALVGLAGAALLNNRGKREGRSRSRAASIGKYIGGAVAGTAGAELITRARSRHREERERSDSVDRELERDRSRGRYDDRGQSRERERSKSPIHAGNWAKLGAVAAIGALAGYAVTRGKGKGDDRRSRSRHRRSSYSRSRSHSRGRSTSYEDSARNPKHRNSVIAGAGLASAAAAGLWEHHRNKSKGREGRSKSRIRTGLPIAATGLAGAALAGLYENRKARKEKATDNRRRSVSPSPTRSGSRPGSVPPYADHRGHDENLIEYGGGSIGPSHARDPAYDHHGRSRSIDSNGSSPRRLSRSRDRGYAEGAAGAGVAGMAAHEAHQRRRRKQQERERRRMEEEEEVRTDTPPNNGDYSFGPYGQAPPPAPQAPGQGQYPSHYYPPQENNNNNYGPPQYQGQPQYGSQNYNYQAPQQPAAPPNPYGYQPPHQQNPPYGDPNDPYGRPNNHVSATPSSPQQRRYVPEHTRSVDLNEEAEERSRVSQDSNRRNFKSVAFNLEPRGEQEQAADRPQGEEEGAQRTRHKRRRRRRHSIDGSDADPHRRPRQMERERSEAGRARSHSPRSDDSGETIELPARFDQDGRRKPQRGDDPFTDRIEDMLSGRLGRMFGRFGRRQGRD